MNCLIEMGLKLLKTTQIITRKQNTIYANISPAMRRFCFNFTTLSYYASNINEFPGIRISLPLNEKKKKKTRQISKARDDTRRIIIDVRFRSARLRVKYPSLSSSSLLPAKWNDSSHTLCLTMYAFSGTAHNVHGCLRLRCRRRTFNRPALQFETRKWNDWIVL